ncbi:MAG: nitroreductase family protein [Candidatus Woesearchaeota archaeon]|nr:nitroreductase family protein [Candidatus Woesearchaeota archaeon]
MDPKEVLELIKRRRSIRKYKDLPVEWDKLINILTAGEYAPSAGNVQDWKFIIVTDDETRKQIARACVNQVWMETAPLHVVICSIPERTIQYYGKAGEKYTIEDCSCAAENMMVQATAEGLGCCLVSAFDEMMMRLALAIPERATPISVLTIGYADEEVPAPPRMMLETIVYLQRYGNRFRNMNAILWDYSLQYEEFAKSAKKEAGQQGKRFMRYFKEKFSKKPEDEKQKGKH